MTEDNERATEGEQPIARWIEEELRGEIERGVYLPGSEISVSDVSRSFHAPRVAVHDALESLRSLGAVSGSRNAPWFVQPWGPRRRGLCRSPEGFWLWTANRRRAQVGLTPTGSVVARDATAAGDELVPSWNVVAERGIPIQVLNALRRGYALLIARAAESRRGRTWSGTVETAQCQRPRGLRITWLAPLERSRSFVSWREADTVGNLVIGAEGSEIRLWPAHGDTPVGEGYPLVRPDNSDIALAAIARDVAGHAFARIESLLIQLGADKLGELERRRPPLA